jgi:uncharacterized protein YecE (DUF72 family)
MARIRIGISGWRYEPWRGIFYPPDLAQARELEFASRAFPSVEINGSFYSLQSPASWRAWHDSTPDDFVFAVKGPRYITHLRRLKDVEKPLANFFASGVFELRDKLGPILWQFPPFFRFDEARFDAFLELLPRNTADALGLARRRDSRMYGRSSLRIHASRPLRHALEIRHESFVTPAFLRLLRRHSVALVVADTAGKWPLVEETTSDFMYLRLHGDRQLYASGYTDAALDRWAEKIRRWGRRREVFCYFDNDVKVRAPFDADRLRDRLGLPRGDRSFVFPGRAALKKSRHLEPRLSTDWRMGYPAGSATAAVTRTTSSMPGRSRRRR